MAWWACLCGCAAAVAFGGCAANRGQWWWSNDNRPAVSAHGGAVIAPTAHMPRLTPITCHHKLPPRPPPPPTHTRPTHPIGQHLHHQRVQLPPPVVVATPQHVVAVCAQSACREGRGGCRGGAAARGGGCRRETGRYHTLPRMCGLALQSSSAAIGASMQCIGDAALGQPRKTGKQALPYLSTACVPRLATGGTPSRPIPLHTLHGAPCNLDIIEGCAGLLGATPLPDHPPSSCHQHPHPPAPPPPRFPASTRAPGPALCATALTR